MSSEDEILRTVLVGFGGNADLVDLTLLLFCFAVEGLQF